MNNFRNYRITILSLVFCTSFSAITKTACSQARLLPERMEEKGAERQKRFFEQLHYPMVNPGPDYYQAVSRDLAKMPKDEEGLRTMTVNSWQYAGGNGVAVNGGSSKYSGRITNMELNGTDNSNLRVMAASGGLWRFTGGAQPMAVSLSDQVSSLWGGAFVTDPNDSTVIFIGTGEMSVHSGTGMFKTTDNGQTWQPVPMTPTPSTFSRILYTPGNTMIMHASTSDGYYRSNDGGSTWVRKFYFNAGSCTDLVINNQNTQVLFLAYWGHGVYKTSDGGDTWVLQNAGIPTSNVGRTALAIGQVNPDIVYVNMTNDNNNNTKGIYKTTDGGTTWATCAFGVDMTGDPATGEFHWGQGWYNNIISVCPTNDNIVLAGGGGLWRATDGFTFNEVDPKHADQHSMVWNQNGTDVFIGNDGGVWYSSNAGFSFSTINVSKFNNLPVSQYYHFSIGKKSANVIAGTTQDNGYHYKSHVTSYDWNCTGGGDGSGVQVDPLDSNVIIHGNGIFGGSLQSHRFITFDAGTNYSNVDNGISTCGDWFPELRISPVLGIYYTACGNDVYYSVSYGSTWNQLNPANPMPADVTDFTVSNDAVADPTVYVCLSNGSGVKLMVMDGISQGWFNRSAGLPSNGYIRKVAVDILDGNVAYALAGGIPANGAGNKVFKTTDRGQTWTNISGNLPNVSVTDLIAYPGNSNLLYLGSEVGCFKSVDGGVTWSTWNNGMPAAALVNELDYADSLAINGKFYVGACTYGRGIWIREVSGDDPAGIREMNENQLYLSQNSSNPGRGLTKIIYSNSYNSMVTLTVTDVTGKIISTPVNGYRTRGRHEVYIDRSNLNEGIYFYRLTAGDKSITRKMMVME